MLTISDFFSLFVDFLVLMILYILMESDKAVQQRQPVGNNEQREQVKRSEATDHRKRGRKPKPLRSANTNYPTENDEGLG